MLSVPVQKFLYILLMAYLCKPCFSQQAEVKGFLNNAPDGKLYLVRSAYPFAVNNVYQGFKEIKLNSNGVFSFSVDILKPEIMRAIFEDSAGKKLGTYNFYLSPGDRIRLKQADGAAEFSFKTTGKGANNNQLLAIDNNDDVEKFYGDTLPGRIITYLQEQNSAHKKTLETYIQKEKPAVDFVNAWKINLQYEMLETYFSFSTNNAYQIDDAYKRNYVAWQGTLDALYRDAPVVNENAMVATLYKKFLSVYLLRTKEAQWKLFRTNRPDFLAEWYGKDTAEGAELFAANMSNDFQQRIIEKYFSGSAREYLYAVLINGALAESDIKNLESVYGKFKSDYPASSYLKLFEERINTVAVKKQQKLTPAMKFIDGAGMFKSWEDILAHYKGQTVLLDMWGTWCGPCRQDLERHAQFIKQHFKGRPLSYLYIANGDTGKEKLWKELIAYFGLEGTHFIAPRQLTTDIMKKVKGEGYPTYIIIAKDGSFELYKRGYGIDREVLFAQIEQALNR